MSAGSVLDEIVAATRATLGPRAQARPLAALQAASYARAERRPFAAEVARPGRVNVIAEFKRRSPSRGVIRDGLAPGDAARAYQAAGAVAMSVLTEDAHFGGRLEDLGEARAASQLPALRKDFVVDPYQVWEAAAAGADAVLLIAAILTDAELGRLLSSAQEAGLTALVEVHDAVELRRAADAGASLLGVNNRDLKTMRVRLETALELAPLLPVGVPAVAESGIRSGADLRRLRAAGYCAFLVGEHLMQAPEPGQALAALIRDAETP
jgi:indole-3-glycerol phosphate synthase